MKIKLKIVALCCFVSSWGQNLSLETALQQGSYSKLEQAQQQTALAKIKLKIQRSKQLPLIYGEANLQRNLIVPVTPVPSIAFNPNAQSGDITPLKFATDWSAKAGLQASLDVFNPSNKINVQTSNYELKKAQLEEKITNQDFKKNLTITYAQGVLAQQQLQFAIQNTNMYQQTYFALAKRYEAGRISTYEINNAEKKRLELLYLVQEAENVLANQYVQLSEFIEMNNIDSLSTTIPQIIDRLQITNTTDELDRIELSKENAQFQAQKNKLLYLPKLTLNAFYGTNFFNNSLDLGNTNYWYGNSYVNLTLRVPISEAYETHLKAKQLELEQQNLDSQLTEAYTNIALKETQKINDIVALKAKIKMLENSLLLSHQNYNIVNQKLLEGQVLVSDLSAEFDSYLQDQKKLWQAQYDLVSKMLE